MDSALLTSQLAHVHNHARERGPYFARKSNIFNQVFVKQAWGWTAGIFLLHLCTSPPAQAQTRVNPALHPNTPTAPGRRTWAQRLAHLVLASLAWIAFTAWFFGPGFGDRIIAATGGACAVPLPSSIDPGILDDILPPGAAPIVTTTPGQPHVPGQTGPGIARVYLPLPDEFCLRRPLTPKTFPALFELLNAAAASAAGLAADVQAGAADLHAKTHEYLRLPPPRWSGGFDISGHAFLLTLGACVLASEVAITWRAWRQAAAAAGPVPTPSRTTASGRLHVLATYAGTGLIGLWVWMLVTTAYYFHDVHEKLAGLALGLFASLAVHMLVPGADRPVIEFKVRGPTRRPQPRTVGSGSGSEHGFGFIEDHGVAKTVAPVHFEGILLEAPVESPMHLHEE